MKRPTSAPLPSALPDARAMALDSRTDRHGERCDRLRNNGR